MRRREGVLNGGNTADAPGVPLPTSAAIPMIPSRDDVNKAGSRFRAAWYCARPDVIKTPHTLHEYAAHRSSLVWLAFHWAAPKKASKSRVSCILGSAWHLPLHSIPFRLRALSPEASLPPSRLQARARRWPISSRSSLDPSCSPPKQPAEVRTTRSACLHVAVSRHPQPQSACLNRWLRERQLSLRRRQNPSLACCRSHCPPGGGLPPALNNHKPTLGLPAMQQVQAAIMPPSGGWPSLPVAWELPPLPDLECCSRQDGW